MGKNLRNEGKKQNIKSILYLSGSLLGIALIAFIVTFVIISLFRGFVWNNYLCMVYC